MPRLPRFLFGSITCIIANNFAFADVMCHKDWTFGDIENQNQLIQKVKDDPNSATNTYRYPSDANVNVGNNYFECKKGQSYNECSPAIYNYHADNEAMANYCDKKITKQKSEPASKAAPKKAETPQKKPEKEVVAKQKTTDIKTINSPNKVSRKRGETEARAEAVKATGLSEPFQCRSVNDDKPNYLCAGSDTGTNIKIVFAGWSEEKSAPKQPAKSANPDEYKYEDDNSFKDFTTFEQDALKRAGNRHSGFMCEKTSSTMVVCTNEKNRTKYMVPFAKIYESKADFEAAEKANSAENPKNEPAGKEEPQSDENNELIEQIKSEAQQILDAYNKRKEELEKQKSSDK